MRLLSLIPLLFAALVVTSGEPPRQVSGIYPHLAMFNNEGECGTGAVVPWAGKLWVITYGPHLPKGSSDKLYEISPALELTIRPESIGGTPANRMIHKESKQLFIGPYAIGEDGNVRAIPYSAMFGRHTGNARHLTDPAGKIYYATMEEGFYEVDVKTLEVKELYKDGNATKDMASTLLPGYHGKGLYSGQGRLIYANNGERSGDALTKPDIPSGCLAEWDGKDWKIVRRNQFTEVTGPGGLEGNATTNDPVWSIGWDYRSLILMLLDGGQWKAFRLPKGSHSYDGAHGWNTEWPRIRDIGDNDGSLLMTMHGTFWKFPKTFSAANTAGIAPRSNYLKVIGDVAQWNGKLVLGCDDTAKSEFLNKRKVKGHIGAPGQSQSNLWFINNSDLDTFGGVIGRGAVWFAEEVKAETFSDPYLFNGYANRGLHLAHSSDDAVTFTLEVDADGKGEWKVLREINVAAKGYAWVEFTAAEKGQWIRVKSNKDLKRATAFFQYATPRERPAGNDAIFAGLATAGAKSVTGGTLITRGEQKRTLLVNATQATDGKVEELGTYELDAQLNLKRIDDAKATEHVAKNAAIPVGVISYEEQSVLVVDDKQRRWRLPLGDAGHTSPALPSRVCREVATERDLFHAHGTFYELPAENAGGFAKIRPAASHKAAINDYCSYRGMLVISGIAPGAAAGEHIVRSDDGKAAVWCGAIDDLWKFGKATGQGGPWKNNRVQAGVASDAFLFTGYDKKSVSFSHDSDDAVTVTIEVDLTGGGEWVKVTSVKVPAKETVKHVFPAAFNAYWVRVTSDKDCTATAWFVYE
jgi:hypothetical protein